MNLNNEFMFHCSSGVKVCRDERIFSTFHEAIVIYKKIIQNYRKFMQITVR